MIVNAVWTAGSSYGTGYSSAKSSTATVPDPPMDSTVKRAAMEASFSHVFSLTGADLKRTHTKS